MTASAGPQTAGARSTCAGRGASWIGSRRSRCAFASASSRIAPAPRVDEEHLARAQPPAAHDPGGGQRDRAGLRRDRDQPVGRHGERRRPQPVPVEDRADPAAVREDDRRRPVPRGEEPGSPPPERRDVGMRRAAQRRRFGHRREERRSEVPAGRDEQLEHLVERLRVRAVGRRAAGRPRRAPGPVAAARPATASAGPAADLLAIAANRVDLAVVGDRAERLGEVPGRLRVGRVALVEERVAERDRPGEVRVEGREAAAGDEALVDDRPARHRRDRQLPEAVRARRGLEPPPGEDEPPLELRIRDRPAGRGIDRDARSTAWATSGRVAAAAAPSATASTGTRRHGCDDEALGRPAPRATSRPRPRGPASAPRQERHRDRRSPSGGRRVRQHLEQRRLQRQRDPGAVARLAVGPERAAVAERRQPAEREPEDPVAPFRPPASATNPIPHASCSNAGS